MSQQTKATRLLIISFLLLGLIGVGAGLDYFQAYANGQPEDLHCPDHESNPKFNVSGGSGTSTLLGVSVSVSGASVSFGQEVQFCVKAGDGASGKQTGTSFTVDWDNNGGQTPDISYVVVYNVIEPTQEPTDEPTQEPTDEPTDEPKEERPFVRVTYICQANLAGIVDGYGLDVEPGDHVWRIRHESGPATNFSTNFLSDVQGSIGIGQTLFFVTQQSANGVKVITSPLDNLYGGTASVSGAICDVPEEPKEEPESLSIVGVCDVENIVWTISNKNDNEVSFTWTANNGQSGQGSVPALSSTKLNTNLDASSITLSYTLNNTETETEGNIEACTEEPPKEETPEPTEPPKEETPEPTEPKSQVDPKPDLAAGGSGPSLGSLISLLVVSGASVGIVSYLLVQTKKKNLSR